MPTSTRAEDQESLSRSRDRIRQMQKQVASGNAKAGAVANNLATKSVTGVLKGLKDMDGLQMFFIGVAGLIDLVGFVLGLLTASWVSAIDWIIDIPLFIFFIFLATILVMSNPSSIKTMLIAFVGPVGVSIAEISPLGVLPFYLGWAVWLVSQINNSKKEKDSKKNQEGQAESKASSVKSTPNQAK